MSDNAQTPMQRMMGDFAPTFVAHTDDVLFGQVWSRPELSPRDRSLVTVTSLAISEEGAEKQGRH